MATRANAKSVIANSCWSVTATLAYSGLSVLSAPVYLHYLGVAQYGIRGRHERRL
jgi:O-antigen/teichoic acid export membrane protein